MSREYSVTAFITAFDSAFDSPNPMVWSAFHTAIWRPRSSA
jgi:hypothetical protein